VIIDLKDINEIMNTDKTSLEVQNQPSCLGAVRRSIAQVLLDDYTNDQLRLVLKETSTRHTKDRVYSEETVRLINHENIKDDDIYCRLGHIYQVVGHVITQKVLQDEF
jgi:hypothetical protein